MKHTKEEILNALQIIKDECYGTRCYQCPFGDTEVNTPQIKCRITRNSPNDWKIAEREEKWKALE